MTVRWTPDLEVGIPDLDAQHRELFARLDRLLEAIVGGDRAEVGRLLEFVGDYVVTHFGAEERWMAEEGYPDYAAHKAEHDLFIQEYLRYTVEFEQKGPSVLVGMRVNNWLAEWLRGHIAGTDQGLRRFVRQRRLA